MEVWACRRIGELRSWGFRLSRARYHLLPFACLIMELDNAMSAHASLKAVRWRDRLLILGGLAVLTLLAWGAMVEMAGRMSDPPAAAGP